ncbi:MAG TPA: amino acid ABC transporter permease [Nordella sp.]|nr:amino acid ABC transporter permease [Nordella sp.]
MKRRFLHEADAAVRWARANLFSGWLSALATIAALVLFFRISHVLLDWAVLGAAFGTTPESCKGISGACWSVIGDFWRIFLVGLYPQGERWRAYAALAAFAILFFGAAVPGWRQSTIYRLAVLLLPLPLLLLLHGGFLGLPVVVTRYWGGLLITIGLAAIGLAVGIPLGILIALGRTSKRLPIIKAGAILFVELVRSVPFVFILILGAIILPMFLPPGLEIDPLLRVQVAIIIAAAANAAEIVRGGLASIDSGQEEAAAALGLGYWTTMSLVVLPQALRRMIPVFVNMFISFLKDTSLVVVVGLFDLLGAASLAVGNPDWIGRRIETLVFVALIYFAMCWIVSRAGQTIETQNDWTAGKRAPTPALRAK